MRFITTVLTIHRQPEGELDRYGNPDPGPVEAWPVEAWPVYAVASAARDEPWEAGRSPRISSLTIYAPLHGPHPRGIDRVSLPDWPGDPFNVVAEPHVWRRNPHVPVTTQQGISVRVERVTG